MTPDEVRETLLDLGNMLFPVTFESYLTAQDRPLYGLLIEPEHTPPKGRNLFCKTRGTHKRCHRCHCKVSNWRFRSTPIAWRTILNTGLLDAK